MKQITAYQCEYCSKTSATKGTITQHEKKCWKNPANKHKCFEFCKFLDLSVDDENRKHFNCTIQNLEMHSYKVDNNKDVDISNLTRMPLQCVFYEKMTKETAF